MKARLFLNRTPASVPSPWRSVALLLALLLVPLSLSAGLLEALGLRRAKSTNTTATLLGAAVSEDQIIAGLKEALGKGVTHAVTNLGRDGGFLTNLNVKIPMPESLQKGERTLRLLGQDQLADDFVASMNHAAEKAVPQAAAVFGDAIRQMTIADAKSILTGPDDAATQFFARTTRTNLYERFLPLVKKATDEVGVTSSYKAMTARLSAADSFGGGLLGNLRKSVVDDQSLDLDAYVNNKALDGLFKMVAEEEKRIRENPVARTSELLQKVFGSLGR